MSETKKNAARKISFFLEKLKEAETPKQIENALYLIGTAVLQSWTKVHKESCDKTNGFHAAQMFGLIPEEVVDAQLNVLKMMNLDYAQHLMRNISKRFKP